MCSITTTSTWSNQITKSREVDFTLRRELKSDKDFYKDVNKLTKQLTQMGWTVTLVSTDIR